MTEITDTLNPSDKFQDVKFVWFISLSEETCLPLLSFSFEYPYLSISVDITGVTECPPVFLDPGAPRLPKPKRELYSVLKDSFIEHSALDYQLVADDDNKNRDAWRRLEFKGKLTAEPAAHFSASISDELRTQLKALGKLEGSQTLNLKFEMNPVVTMTGDWDKVPRKKPPKPSKVEAALSFLARSSLALAKDIIHTGEELTANAMRDAEDRKLLQAEMGVWHSHKPYPQLFEEIQNWLSRPIAAGDRFSVNVNPSHMQMQASLSFSEYVAPRYPDCPRTITLMLDFVPRESGTTVKYEWVVLQELHAGSFHGPQMIRIVNNGIRHWCTVDTDPAI